jgi:TonB-dependent SusC/RagA subfamily outer membrane receptor
MARAPRRWWRRGGLVTLATLVWSPSHSAAQQPTGTIIGVVTSPSGAPLSEVQVFLAGTQQGALSSNRGQYIIRSVAPGVHQLQAVRIGYSPSTQEVTVTAGESVVVDFILAEQALALDEIVVTGTAGAARRREVGNSIVQINTADVASPPPSVDQLLQAQSPGLLVSAGNGSSGSGAQIRLRGAVSVSQSNQPIVYIDGVRIKNDAYERNISPTEGAGRGGNVTASPLNDLNPGDIERIEVLKGSAASTLYGTEAAAGVIQIFTKRGTIGAPRWTMQIDQGFNKLLPFAPDVDVRPPSDITPASPRGSYSYELMNLEPYLRSGHRQKYALSVAGGAQALQYFISGQWDGNEGVLPLDNEEKTGVRGNFTFTPISQLSVQVTSAYNRTDIRNTPAGNNAQGLILNAFRRERNYFASGNPDTIRLVLTQDVNTRVDRFVIGSTVTYDPGSNFDTRLTVGYDNAHQDNRQLRPYGYRQLPTGKLYTSSGDYSTLTADLVASYRLGLGADRGLTLSLGGQSITEDERIVEGEGTDFAGPGEPDIDAGANRLSWERRVRVVTAGFFGQALLSLKDRYFLTVGARVDGNSAFGEDFGLQTYPKVSASYVISDEDFWSDALGAVKLRAAYGQSGRAPGTFDAVRTWAAQGYGGQPAYIPSNLGNPDLGPERTGEIEVGFDWSGVGDRLAADFTWYRQKTTDALFEVRHAPSEGFATQQQENVGEIQNQGIELNLKAALIDRADWGLDLGASIYTNETEVLSLGGSPPFAGNTGWIQEGQPVTLIRGVRIRNGDQLVDPTVCADDSPATATCVEVDVPIGPQQPTHVLGFSAAVRLPYGVELSARGEYQGGHYIYDGPSNEGVNRDIRWPTCADYYELTDNGRGDEATADRRYWCDQDFYRRGTMIYPADFFKLRDVTARIALGNLIPGSASSTLTLSAQNWYRWRNDDFPIFDPEMVTNAGFDSQNPQITEHIPPTAAMVASLRVVF